MTVVTTHDFDIVTLASWQVLLLICCFAVTTQDFLTKLLRRGRLQVIFYQFLDRGRYECADPDAVFFKDRSDYLLESIPEAPYYSHRVLVGLILPETSFYERPEVVVDQLLDVRMGVMGQYEGTQTAEPS